MISAEQNDFITRVGPEAPAGILLRRYWQPAALAEELAVDRPVKALRLLGMDLVLFRDDKGQVGLIDRDCPHRGADLAYGRLEDGGLRCLFHGWLFGVDGKCLEMPAEPEGSPMCGRIRQRSYPVREMSGIIFCYLGDGEPPAFPALDCFVAPGSHVFAFKGHLACNWLQALEVGLDPAHASFLHRFFHDEETETAYGRQFRDASADSDIPMTKVLRDFPQPEITVDPSPIGLRIMATRDLGGGRTHIRVTNLLFPQAFVIPMSRDMTITQWHAPIDDTNTYWYAIFTSFTDAVDKAAMRQQRLELYSLPDYRPKLGRSNNYGFDKLEQKNLTYTGMGEDINLHDQWAVESQGTIQNRTREHLGQTDKAISAFRRLLVAEIKRAVAGEPVFLELDAQAASRIQGPATMDGIGATDERDRYWREVDERRRRGAPWFKSESTVST